MFHAIAQGFNYLFGWIPGVLSWLLNALWQLFKPVLDFIGGIFYFIYKIGLVLVKVIEVILYLGKLLLGISTGLFKTIVGLGYTGSTERLPNSYSAVFAKLSPILDSLQLDKVAYLLIFAIWFFTAFAAMRIIGNMRGGGGD